MKVLVFALLVAVVSCAGVRASDAEADAELDAAVEQALSLSSQALGEFAADATENSASEDAAEAEHARLNADAELKYSAFMQLHSALQRVKTLPAEEQQVVWTAVQKYDGDVGRLKLGELTRLQQSELIPLVMSYNRDLNLAIARAAHIEAGEADEDSGMPAFVEAAAATDLDTEADVQLGTMSDASLDALLMGMSEATLAQYQAIKTQVLERVALAALTGADEVLLLEWPDFIDKAYNSVKETASNAYNAVKNVDINAVASKVGEVAHKVGDVAGKVAEYSGPIAAATSFIPYVGAATRAIDTAARGTAAAANAVAAGADWVKDNTKPGETLGHAMGRAKDAVVDTAKNVANKAAEYAKDPSKLAKDVGDAAKNAYNYCKDNPQACLNKAADLAKGAAKLAGRKDLADKIDKVQDAGNKVADALGHQDKKDQDKPEKPDGEKPDAPEKPDGEKPEKPEGGERGGKGDKPDGGDKPEKPEGGDRDGGDRRGGGGKGRGGGGDRDGGDRDGGDRRGRGGGGRDRGDRKGGDRDRGGR